ncbi:hypothetical protein SAMN05216188_102164 [Lentzea xinjiangensis]|uniref:Uncharacterized protein n=1 Tax=Lentzea xinjiangensis TaxID=402600 RepID=A0A1H9DK85_9PSEU|nr:hypothetical protein [Lentzea xinjiangensis]SEQ13138.1 hypothetical protein SAMN05216188_102164 [Lentzea xinjiangensis]
MSPPHVVRLELDTFADVDRPALATWFDAVFTGLLAPLCPASVAELVSVARDYVPSDTTPWGPPGYARLLLSSGEFTPSAWALALAELPSFLRVQMVGLDSQGLPLVDGGWSAEVLLKDDPAFPHQISVTASRSLFGGWISHLVQQEWLSALRTGASLVRACGGWITLDRVGPRTAHEVSAGVGLDESLFTAAELCRGPHWATLLGPRQVAALGGVLKVCGSAPCFSVEDLGGGRILLRLTEHLDEVPDDALRELAGFLGPVLR